MAIQEPLIHLTGHWVPRGEVYQCIVLHARAGDGNMSDICEPKSHNISSDNLPLCRSVQDGNSYHSQQEIDVAQSSPVSQRCILHEDAATH